MKLQLGGNMVDGLDSTYLKHLIIDNANPYY